MKSVKGFTFVEFMITVLVVVILGSLAAPAYINYTRRAYYSEIVAATLPFKAGIKECFEKTGVLKGCSGGLNHVPANVTKVTGNVASIVVVDGVITAVPVPAKGIEAADIYVVKPTVDKKALVWNTSGNSVVNAYAD